MKRFANLLALVIITSASGFAGNTYSDDPRFTDKKLKAIEQSLQLALESGNRGVKESAAQVVRDVKALVPRYEFSRLIIPLLRIVKDERTRPASRIIAALALHELGGDFVIEAR